jgi:hypothetical protein
MNEANTVSMSRPSLKQRFWFRLGYRAQWPESIDDHPKAKGMPGWFSTKVFIGVSWGDRLRLLLSGRALVRLECRANVVVDDVISSSSFSVLAPIDRRPFILECHQDRAHLDYGVGCMEMGLPYQQVESEILNNAVWNLAVSNTKMYRR